MNVHSPQPLPPRPDGPCTLPAPLEPNPELIAKYNDAQAEIQRLRVLQYLPPSLTLAPL